MRTFLFRPLAGALLCACLSAHAGTAAADLAAAFTDGKASLDARLRYERADSAAAAITDEAQALTLRTRLGYQTATWFGFDGRLEYEGVSAARQDAYNSGSNGVTDRPLIPDPTGSELNQAWLRYRGLPWTTVTFGRQRYTLDNQRFVGNSGWRQNEQTFDGISTQITPQAALNLQYAWFHNIDTVLFGNVAMNGAQLLNLHYRVGPVLDLSAYGYWLDFKEASSAANRQDSRTLGLRASGRYALRDALTLSYAGEYAAQRPYADAGSQVDADYRSVELGLSYRDAQLKIGDEILGSRNGRYGFQTPLATLHAFNGWADLFLATPADGLRDRYVNVSATQWQTTATLAWHRYDADHGGNDDGREWDLSLTRPLTTQLSVLAGLAHYEARQYGSDLDRLWLQVEFKI